jgi:hypothetical protein
MVSITRFGSCYLHQSRFPGHNLCYIGNSAFVVSAPVIVMMMMMAMNLS